MATGDVIVTYPDGSKIVESTLSGSSNVVNFGFFGPDGKEIVSDDQVEKLRLSTDNDKIRARLIGTGFTAPNPGST